MRINITAEFLQWPIFNSERINSDMAQFICILCIWLLWRFFLLFFYRPSTFTERSVKTCYTSTYRKYRCGGNFFCYRTRKFIKYLFFREIVRINWNIQLFRSHSILFVFELLFVGDGNSIIVGREKYEPFFRPNERFPSYTEHFIVFRRSVAFCFS